MKVPRSNPTWQSSVVTTFAYHDRREGMKYQRFTSVESASIGTTGGPSKEIGYYTATHEGLIAVAKCP